MTFSDYLSDPAYAIYIISGFLFVPMLIISVIASVRVNSVFNKYNHLICSSGISAQGYAKRFLYENGVHGVRFAAARGSLTDNYDPRTRVISLSDTVRNSSAVGAIGVACHECGHAIQHNNKYFFSELRLKLVPIVNAVSALMWPIFIIGFIFGFASPYTFIGRTFIITGLVVLGFSLLFALVTLPTEFDASRRAYKFLKGSMLPDEAAAVKKVLNAAAMTYVVSFMMSALQFLRLFALLLIGRRR